jgi:hypothetical protein
MMMMMMKGMMNTHINHKSHTHTNEKELRQHRTENVAVNATVNTTHLTMSQILRSNVQQMPHDMSPHRFRRHRSVRSGEVLFRFQRTKPYRSSTTSIFASFTLQCLGDEVVNGLQDVKGQWFLGNHFGRCHGSTYRTFEPSLRI